MDLRPPRGDGQTAPGEPTVSAIGEIDLGKTAARLSAAADKGGILGDGTRDQVEALSRYGRALALPSPIADDILDVTGCFEEGDAEVLREVVRMAATRRS